jgi:FMN phosphatase YigB (HAD superfamily)
MGKSIQINKIILFDYFGVVASDAYWYAIKGVEKMSGRGQEIDELSSAVNDGRISWEDYCAQVAVDLSIPIEEVRSRFQQHNINEAVVSLIVEVAQTNTVSLASNAAAEHMRPILDSTGLSGIFDELFFSSDIGASKPSREFFEHIWRFYDRPPNHFVLIDDASGNVEAAREYGMGAVQHISTTTTRLELRELLDN